MWKDKVCIITGSSLGIGKQLAIEICNKGGKVVLNARNEIRLENTRKELFDLGFEVISLDGDISNFRDCHKIIAETIKVFGRLDVLINNAGISADGILDGFNPTVYKNVIDINFMGAVLMTQAALPFLKESGGSILFVSSIAGIHGLGGHSAYCCSKMALTALAESLRIETSSLGITIGIAYVSFTQNDPQKTIYNSEGKLIPQPTRNLSNPEPVEKVAKRIMNMIERKTFKKVFTRTGKLTAILNRFVPFVLYFILFEFYKRSYIKSQ